MRTCFNGAADRDRTGMDFTPRDFKSLVSAYFTTAALNSDLKNNPITFVIGLLVGVTGLEPTASTTPR